MKWKIIKHREISSFIFGYFYSIYFDKINVPRLDPFHCFGFVFSNFIFNILCGILAIFFFVDMCCFIHLLNTFWL